jgi:hypothetical protein
MNKDTRYWEVAIEVPKNDCPYRYSTDEYIQCLNYDKKPNVGTPCCLEECPIKIG